MADLQTDNLHCLVAGLLLVRMADWLTCWLAARMAGWLRCTPTSTAYWGSWAPRRQNITCSVIGQTPAHVTKVLERCVCVYTIIGGFIGIPVGWYLLSIVGLEEQVVEGNSLCLHKNKYTDKLGLRTCRKTYPVLYT